MNKEQWQNLYKILDQAHSDFHLAYSAYKNGKNIKIRKEGERNVDIAINLATTHIHRNPEAFILLTGGETATDYSRAIILDEFRLPRYFGDDMTEFLKKIQGKIKSFE